MLRRSLRFSFAASLLTFVAAACSSGGGDPSASDPVGSTHEAITSGCTLGQVGAPCDPDGPGPASECGGVCVLALTFTGVRCAATSAIGDDNGKVCGQPANRKSDCTKTCLDGVCASLMASAGTSCKPTDDSAGTTPTTICDGSCQPVSSGSSEMTCTALTTGACPKDTNPNDCVYNFCSASTATTCVDIPHPAGDRCATGLACTTNDQCDSSGTCVAGPPVTCPPSTNPCVSNVCTEPTGCGPVDVTGSCTPTSACFTAGTCTGGTCVGTTAKDCSDGDPCTTDTCSDFFGCQHTAKCTADVCHVASCDATTGTCSTTEKNCNDGDPCTTDGCSLSAGGCTHTPIPGCGVDSGVPDTGPIDTGVADTGTIADSGTIVDSGTVVDSGAATDTGSTTTDSGASADTGSKTDGGGKDTGGTLDGATVDSGTESGTDDNADVQLKSGCGCRVAGEESSSTSAASMVALVGALAFLARRRRRA